MNLKQTLSGYLVAHSFGREKEYKSDVLTISIKIKKYYV